MHTIIKKLKQTKLRVMNNNENNNNNTTCCREYCNDTFEANGEELVNRYKCNQNPFTASDLWNIQKDRKLPVRRNGI